MFHASEACKHENTTKLNKFAILVASLLHDVDDSKYFSTKNFENARNLIKDTIESLKVDLSFMTYEWIELVIEMISLVSCSKNGNAVPNETWKLIPRLADRLDAIGTVGIERTIAYNKMKNRPMHDENTKRVYSLEELNNVASLERFNGYLAGKNEFNTIGHMYDKLIHIGRPEYFGTDNQYIVEEANKSRKIMENFVIQYWKDIRYMDLLEKIC
jgi:uncharacterized protein